MARMVSISWPRDLLASASQSAGITGVSHQDIFLFKMLGYNVFTSEIIKIFIYLFYKWQIEG